MCHPSVLAKVMGKAGLVRPGGDYSELGHGHEHSLKMKFIFILAA